MNPGDKITLTWQMDDMHDLTAEHEVTQDDKEGYTDYMSDAPYESHMMSPDQWLEEKHFHHYYDAECQRQQELANP